MTLATILIGAAIYLVVIPVIQSDDANQTEAPTDRSEGGRFSYQPGVYQEVIVDDALVRFYRTGNGQGLIPHASAVRITATLIDSGKGFELCVTDIGTSEPPVCSGPIVEGLTGGRWATESEGSAFGMRTVTVTWPPTNGAVQLLDVAAPQSNLTFPNLRGLPDSYPSSCGGREPCLGSGSWTIDELQSASTLLLPLQTEEGPVTGNGYGNRAGRVMVQVVIADQETVDQVLALVPDPEMVVITAMGVAIE